MIIEPYHFEPIHYWPYEAALAAVSEAVMELLAKAMIDATPEHIGSTAVPGTPGKNIINLIIPSVLDQFDARLRILESIGFSASPLNKPEPPTRPLRVGSVMHGGKRYNLHVHLVESDSTDYHAAIFFREYLQHHPEAVIQYALIKKTAVEAGMTDAISYNKAKEPFIRSILAKRSER